MERRSQIYREKYIIPFVLRLRKLERYDESRKCYLNKVRAWKSQHRKLAAARRPETPARRRRIYKGIRSMIEEHNPPMKAHGFQSLAQTLRWETSRRDSLRWERSQREMKEARRLWKLQQAKRLPPSQRDEAAESQLSEAPARRRRLRRGIKPRAGQQNSLIQTYKPLWLSHMLREEYREAMRRWKLQQVHQLDSIQEDECAFP